MISKILISLAAVFIPLAVFIATRPADFRIQRSKVINAPPAAIFPQINDLHKMNEWSPWAKMDSNAKNTYSGQKAGTGASMSWSGNNEVGAGTMTITDSRPNEFVAMRLEFLRPFYATNRTEFTLKSVGPGTQVTWTMTGKNNFVAKAFNLVIDCDKMVGRQFEIGLDNLKARVGSATPVSATTSTTKRP